MFLGEAAAVDAGFSVRDRQGSHRLCSGTQGLRDVQLHTSSSVFPLQGRAFPTSACRALTPLTSGTSCFLQPLPCPFPVPRCPPPACDLGSGQRSAHSPPPEPAARGHTPRAPGRRSRLLPWSLQTRPQSRTRASGRRLGVPLLQTSLPRPPGPGLGKSGPRRVFLSPRCSRVCVGRGGADAAVTCGSGCRLTVMGTGPGSQWLRIA